MSYVSFGAGTQSTALAFLVMNRDDRLRDRANLGPDESIHWPDIFLFADTGDEPRSVYRHTWKMAKLFDHHDIELRIVRGDDRSLSDHVIDKADAGESGISTPPLFVEGTDDRGRNTGIPIRRSCTADFKARPLDAEAKRYWSERLDVDGDIEKSNVLVDQWLGISNDEKRRMRESEQTWRRYKYPLIEMGWTRWHCQQYLKDQTYLDGSPVEIVRSACVFCPFHSKEEWRHVRDSDSDDWERAKEFQDEIYDIYEREDGFAGVRKKPHINRWAKPIEELDLEDDDDQLDMWNEYAFQGVGCVGHCGV